MSQNDLTNNKTIKQRKYMLVTIIVGVVALAGGFVFGVLFGRKNIATVNAAITSANNEIAVLKADVATKLAGSSKAATPTVAPTVAATK